MRGVDLSKWQRGIDVAALGADFAIVQACKGVDDFDTATYEHADAVLAAGMLLGMYHYAKTGAWKDEADAFLSRIEPYIGRCLIALDWEGEAVYNGSKWALEWLDYVAAKTGATPCIYLNGSGIAGDDWEAVAVKYPLWLANYTAEPYQGWDDSPEVRVGTWPWDEPLIHQYTSQGRLGVYGGNLDLDIGYLDRAEWRRLEGRKSMRVCIDMGHTPTSTGASGYLDELECDRALGARVITELERRGHTVYNSTPPDSYGGSEEIDYRWRYANARDIDLFVSLHLNAAGGTGTEVLYYQGDSTGQAYASRISEKVASALGLPNRGAKANNWVGVICNTNATAVLIEVCFVDRYEDYLAWSACPWDKLVNAVCDGIDGEKHEEDDMNFDDAWFGGKLNSSKTPASGSSTTPANLLWEGTVEIHDIRKDIAELAEKVKGISTPSVDYDVLADKVAAKVGDGIAEKVADKLAARLSD